jgi:hypothetical protein
MPIRKAEEKKARIVCPEQSMHAMYMQHAPEPAQRT